MPRAVSPQTKGRTQKSKTRQNRGMGLGHTGAIVSAAVALFQDGVTKLLMEVTFTKTLINGLLPTEKPIGMVHISL